MLHRVLLLKPRETTTRWAIPRRCTHVIELLRTLGLEESTVNNVQVRIQAKSKAEKSNSELVAELERKRDRAQSHAVELQESFTG